VREKDTAPPKLENQDLTPVLETWSYEEGRTIRRLEIEGGREVIQVRLPLGIEQYEIDGRPDGRRPMGRESWLHYYLRKKDSCVKEERTFMLDKQDVERLQEEGLLYYHRYIVFFQIADYGLCARDTRRNLKLLDFVAQHAEAAHAVELVQYRPYILRMNFTARALAKIQSAKDLPGAVRILRHGFEVIRRIDGIEGNQVIEFEKARSLRCMEDLLAQLEAKLPLPPRVALQRQLERAIRKEAYEEAARLRDEIADLRKAAKGAEPASS
jgi:hypothetical protein